MIVRVDGATYRGRAVDLTGRELAPGTVAEAVRGDRTDPVSVHAPVPGRMHDHLAVLRPDISFHRRGALAAAARSRGVSAPADGAIADLTAELTAVDPPPADTTAERRRLAASGEARERLRERVTRLQGRVRARRDAELDAGDAADELTAAARELSEVETEHAAARQALSRARDRAREARDVRDRQFALEDRLSNRRRAARAHLAGTVEEAVDRAAAAVPSPAGGTGPSEPFSLGLAVVRVAAVAAPVVVTASPFESVEATADWLATPVIEV